jgi:hypothetical protein
MGLVGRLVGWWVCWVWGKGKGKGFIWGFCGKGKGKGFIWGFVKLVGRLGG